MADLGTIAILLGLGLALYSVVGSVLGRAMGVPEMVVSARRAGYMTVPVTLVAAAALVAAFVAYDFTIEYVALNSSRVMDRPLIWVAFYAGNAGSLLFIAAVFAIMAAIAIHRSPSQLRGAQPYSTAILMGVLALFLAVTAFFANPFAQLDSVPTDGRGLSPLLRHPAMFVHPPLLMTGLAGVAIPFSYAIGALISGTARDEWLDAARISGIIVWAILGAGILIGAWWAYTILGWGGYWGWDPIENVAFMPWLVLTAFVHSIMVQKRRGMFRMWNIVLLNIAFVLAQFGMFINRGGPVVSVHSFAASTLGQVFLSFMVLSVVFAFGVFFWRYNALKSDRPIESFLSREVAFLVNNFLLLAVTFVTLWGVVFPLITEFASDGTVTVAKPYFDKVNGPLLLALLVVMGIGPVMAWRRSSPAILRRWLAIPALFGLLTAAGLLIAGIREPLAVLTFAILGFVTAVILEEWIRGTRARVKSGDNPVTAFARLIAGNRPRHGGYIVHLSILVLAFGVVGTQFFDKRADLVIPLGGSATIGAYRLEYKDRQQDSRPDMTAQRAEIDVYRGDKLVDTVHPWYGFFPDFRQATVRAAIRTNPVEDLYLVPSEFLADGRLVIRASINPLAWWLWVAGPVFLLGTVVALWPQSVLETRPVRVARPLTPAADGSPTSSQATRQRV